MQELKTNIDSIESILKQIRKLREELEKNLRNGELSKQNILEVLAEAMQGVSSVIGGEINSVKWQKVYLEIPNNIVSEQVIETILLWEKSVTLWCNQEKNAFKDNMISKRQQYSYEDIMKIIDELLNMVKRQEENINKLYANNNILKGWHREINKEKVDYSIEVEKASGITEQKRNVEIIVSLTSFPERMYDIKYALYSLLHQSMKPDRVILWLAREQFPNLENDIASSVLELKKMGLAIMWCEDIKSYKKYIPTRRSFPNAIIVTADDDMYYPENWLELLYNSYLQRPDCIHCHRAHKVKMDNREIKKYNMWEKSIYLEYPSFEVFPTTGSGVLYPPNLLYKDLMNKKYFMELAPNADDIWFWAMSVLNRTKIKIVKNGIRELNWVNPARELGLYNEFTLSRKNTGIQAENDIYLKNVIDAYPQLIEIIIEERNRGIEA